MKTFYLHEDMENLKKYARVVDTIDAGMGPLESLFELSADPYFASLGMVFRSIELLFLKAPFVITYLYQTQDYAALLDWVPRELVANMVPYANVIDIHPAYLNRVKKHEQKTNS